MMLFIYFKNTANQRHVCFFNVQVPCPQCNTNIFKYLNIRIKGTEYYIFKYKYSIFLFRIYSIFIFGQDAKNEYIRYSYSVGLEGTNIFDIRIRSGCEERIYSIFVFGEIFPQMDSYNYTLTTRQQKLTRSA